MRDIVNDGYIQVVDFDCTAGKKGPKLIEVGTENYKWAEMNRNSAHLHAHNHTEIMYVAAGRWIFNYNNENVEVKKGDILIIAPGVRHMESWADEFAHYTITVAPLALNFERNNFIIRDTEYNADFAFYIRTIVEKILVKEENYKLFAHNLFNCFIHELYHFDKEMHKQSVHAMNPTANNVAMIMKNYLDSNCRLDIHIKDVCKITYCSEHHAINQFKEAFGITPLQYLLRVRMQDATRMLLTRDSSISQIGFLSGFNNTLTFIYHFKNLLGTTPQAFREKYKKNTAKGFEISKSLSPTTFDRPLPPNPSSPTEK